MYKIGLVRTSYFVYIMTNTGNSVLYTGVTSDLLNRCQEHQNKKHPDSFSARYNVNKLVYYEQFERIETAIAFEKKIDLIEQNNPRWNDLYGELLAKWS